MENDLKIKMEDDLKKNGRRPQKNGRRPQKKWKKTSKKMENDHKYNLKNQP